MAKRSKKKRQRGGSGKGNPYERAMCYYFSEWWTYGVDKTVFWRTDQSGGRSTQRRKTNKKHIAKWQMGDMTFEDPIGRPFISLFLIEFKRGYTKEASVLGGFIDGKKKYQCIWDWWVNAERQRKAVRRPGTLIICRRDRKNDFVIINLRMFNKIKKYAGCLDKPQVLISKRRRVRRGYNTEHLLFIRFDHFMEWITPEILMKLVPERYRNDYRVEAYKLQGAQRNNS